MDYALVTGGSKGIGRAVAEELAQRGYSLLLVARSESLLREMAASWAKKWGIDVQYLVLDLERPEAPGQVKDWVTSLRVPLRVLVNNAGYGVWGNFYELSLERQSKMLQINIGTVFKLTHLLLPFLGRETPSYILNIGSMAGLQAMPTFNAYAASKAFVNAYSRALHYELKPLNIFVTLVMPGSVATDFVKVADMQHMEQKAQKASLSPQAVAKVAVKALFKKKIAIIPGRSNKWMGWAVKHIPTQWAEKIAASLYRKKI